MREIGSEFWDVSTVNIENNIFPNSTQWFLSGRSALQAIINELGEARSVSLPSWCCESMIRPFVDAGMNVHFYPVYWREGQFIQEIDSSYDILLLMDYFGYGGYAPELGGFKGTIIRDVTHSIFSTTYSDADFSFGSLRKWCGVWTGGYAWTRDGRKLHREFTSDNKYVSLRKKAMLQKAEYINGVRDNKEYLQIFNQAEKLLDSGGALSAADRDVLKAKQLDVEKIRNRRRTNAEVLRAAFYDWLIFPNLLSSDVPLFVPIFVPDGKRNEVRRYLIKHDIYCPVHWPVSDYHRLEGKEQLMYDNELSLVCDQRYTEEDMYRIVETIKDFLKEV